MEVSREVIVWEKIIKNSLDIICTVDQHGCFASANEAIKDILGYEPGEVLGQPLSYFIHPADVDHTLNTIKGVTTGIKVKNFENRYIHKSGYEVLIMWSAVWSEEDELIIGIGRDVTDLQLARQKGELHEIFVEHGADMLALFDEELNYLYSGGSTLRQLGYTHEQLTGTNALSYIHPDDIPMAKESVSKVMNSEGHGHLTAPAFRFRDANGEWRWLETTISNRLHHPSVKALVTSSRDVTEKVNSRLKLKESEQRFKSLFENHLDIVMFQDKAGIISDVNETAALFLGVPKQYIINRPVSDFLTPDIIDFHDEMLRRALSGESVRFEAPIPFEGKGVVTFDISKIPVIVNGETVGVYSILRDITEIKRSNNIIKQQANKLNNIMESITDAFFTLDKNWNFTYINSALERLFRTERNRLLGKNFCEIDLADLREQVYKDLHAAVETGKTAHFEAHLAKYGMWLQVKAFPSEEGLSVFANDITEKVKSRQELEKLSLVASKTTNGVVITDADGFIEWVNEGFTNLTGYTLFEVAGKTPGSVLVGEETDKTTYTRLLEQRAQGKPFHDELLIYKKSGEKEWLMLDITPVYNEAGELTKFVTIQTNVTDKKEAEASQLQLTKDLYWHNKDLQQFTYIVSHNLRSPVANTMGLVDVLSMIDKESDDFDLSLSYLKKSVHQLDTVLRDLNTILSVRHKKDTVDRERIQLTDVCRQVLANLQESLLSCGGDVAMDVGEDIWVQGDKAYLYSIFYNLLSNSIKYRSGKRPLKVSIKCLGSTESGMIISFTDNGSGFDMNLAGDKVFKLYKRFHSNSEGRGIGLFLVKTHLEAMGGDIEVTSQVNVGTRFLIYLK